MTYLLFIVKSALFDFSRNKLRTLLTSLGILIGVSSVVLLIAFGLGLKAYIREQFESLGSNLVYVIPGTFSGGAGFRPGAFGAIRFDEEDFMHLEKIKESIAVAGIFSKTVRVATSGDAKTIDVFATTAKIFSIRNLEAEFGDVFTSRDLAKRNKVAVLGPKIAGELFDNPEQSIGKTIKIESQAYTVMGILLSKGGGGFGGPEFDNFIYVPYTSALQLNPNKEFISFYIQAKTEEEIPIVKEKTNAILTKRYKEDVFSVVEQTEIISTVTSIFSVLNTVLVAIGAISLVVGGVGIMNIMYVTVTERIKEIGVRRAVGATKRDILMQFLTEAVILSLIGGFAGLLLSFLITLIIQRFFPAYIDTASVLIALFVSSLVGIVFGV
ncbi:MAG: ABC transporter permease, partial [bacterium]|nr:ABC transporter permease [bacterium]